MPSPIELAAEEIGSLIRGESKARVTEILHRHFGEDATPIACKARASASDPPQDCDWPFCGCDPRADKVLATLQECGLEIVKPVAIGTESAKAFLKSAVDKCAFGSPLGIVPFSAFESIAEVMRDYAALGISATQPPSPAGASE